MLNRCSLSFEFKKSSKQTPVQQQKQQRLSFTFCSFETKEMLSTQHRYVQGRVSFLERPQSLFDELAVFLCWAKEQSDDSLYGTVKTIYWISLDVLGEAGLKMYSIFMSLSLLFVIICLMRIAFTPVSAAHARYEYGYFYLQVYCHEYQMIYLMGPRPERTRGNLSVLTEKSWVRNTAVIHNRCPESLLEHWTLEKDTMWTDWYCLLCNQMIRCFCDLLSLMFLLSSPFGLRMAMLVKKFSFNREWNNKNPRINTSWLYASANQSSLYLRMSVLYIYVCLSMYLYVMKTLKQFNKR